MSETVTVGGLQLSGLNPTQRKALEVLSAGGTLKDVRGLSKEDVETIYAIGYNLYNQAQYDKAEPMFQFACFYEHAEPRYWVALGNCRQMTKNYERAIDAYGFGYALDINNPWPVIQTAICYLALQDKEQAADALALAEKTIESSMPNDTARQRIAALRQAL
jgi:type III secretion system low calcium response chaperone LcrH/SycD